MIIDTTSVNGIYHSIIEKDNKVHGGKMKFSIVLLFIPKEIFGDNIVKVYWSANIVQEFRVFQEIYNLEAINANNGVTKIVDQLEERNNLQGELTTFSINDGKVLFERNYLGGCRKYEVRLLGSQLVVSVTVENDIIGIKETILDNIFFDRV